MLRGEIMVIAREQKTFMYRAWLKEDGVVRALWEKGSQGWRGDRDEVRIERELRWCRMPLWAVAAEGGATRQLQPMAGGALHGMASHRRGELRAGALLRPEGHCAIAMPAAGETAT